MLILWVCVIIAVVVFGAMIYSIVKFRHSQGAVPASFDHSTRAEVIWTIIPIAILVGMAVPAAETLIKIEDTRDSDLTIKVTGYQWKWHYDYLDQDVAFFSTLARESDAARQLDSGIDPHTGRELPARRRQSARRAAGREGARAAHRKRRHSRVVGAGVRHEEGRHPRLRQRNLVPRG